MIRHLASAAVAAALLVGTAGCEIPDPATSPDPVPAPAPETPLHKGDPGVPDQNYPTEMAPDERSNGRWMVKAIRTDGPGDYSVMCWIDSDEATLTKVDVTYAKYEEYLDVRDTGSIPCPEVPR